MAFRNDVEGRAIAEINVTPLVDVMLVLLIIFMITAPVLANQITINVGKSDVVEPDDSVRVALEITDTGDVRWDGQLLPRAALDAQLRHAAAQSPQPTLEVDAEAHVAYEHVASVLASIEREGITQVGFAR